MDITNSNIVALVESDYLNNKRILEQWRERLCKLKERDKDSILLASSLVLNVLFLSGGKRKKIF